MRRGRRLVAGIARILATLSLVGPSSLVGAQGAPPTGLENGEWRDYAGDSRGLSYSPLSQINEDNVTNLTVAWRWPSADRAVQASNARWLASRYEDTPLMVNGVLYTATPLGIVAALDPATGRTRWTFDPESYRAGRPHSIGYSVRGLSYWTDGVNERIIHSSNDAYLFSIDAKTGRLDPAFGNDGRVDLTEGVRNAVRSVNFTGRRAIVAGDVLVVGNALLDPPAGRDETTPPGEVMAFDARSGERLWTFHIVPREGEFGYDTWLDGSAERTGNANAWAGMTWDPDLDHVYIATSSAGNDRFGATRPGDNLFADSLICVEAKTGERVWHFQAIHHDLWDWDFVTQPALIDITVGGRPIEAVVGINKPGFVYVLDRVTGEPVWPIPETPVPQSTAPNGEWTSPTQPIPTAPFALNQQGSLPDNVIDFTPELRARALEQLLHFEYGPIYTPPSVTGTLVVPGALGGANWGGAAFDPETQMLYVPSRMTFTVSRARMTDAPPAEDATQTGTAQQPRPPARGSAGGARGRGAGGPNLNALAVIDGLPIIKPPYARVTALDLREGEQRWMTPLGNGPRSHPLLKDLDLPPLGDAVHGGAPLVTKTLLFVGVTNTFVTGLPQPAAWQEWSDPGWERKLLYVFDKHAGQILRVIEMDGLSMAAPMTYLHDGKQYIAVAVGNGEESELVAFSLPGPAPN